MENAPPPYTPGDFGKGAPYPTNPDFNPNQPYYPPTGGAPYPPAQAPYPNQAPYPPTQPGYPPSQPGYPNTQAPYPVTQAPYPVVQAGYPVVQAGYPVTQAPTQTVIVRSGSCPACGIGTVSKEITCCGVCCALVFFPVGIICCIAMMESKCNSCHAKF